jgi:hypothetical protein
MYHSKRKTYYLLFNILLVHMLHRFYISFIKTNKEMEVRQDARKDNHYQYTSF